MEAKKRWFAKESPLPGVHFQVLQGSHPGWLMLLLLFKQFTYLEDHPN